MSHYLDDGAPLILDGGLATELEAQGAKLQVLDIETVNVC